MAAELPRLIVITDWSRPQLLERLDDALGAGPGIAVQHRNPGVNDREFLLQARTVQRLCARRGAPLFVNRRLDVALLVGAHLHLPSSGLLATDVRPHLPNGRWVSAAVHDEAEAARAAGADLALVSPVFAPLSKPEERSPLGVAGFVALAKKLACPAYALGGVSPVSVEPLLPVAGVAVISAVLDASRPRDAAARLLQLVGERR